MPPSVAPATEWETLVESTYSGPCVYLLHFHRPFQHAQHYLGATLDLAKRMHTHRQALADSSSIMRAIHAAGIGFALVRVWKCSEEDVWITEKALKRTKKGAWYCPLCRPSLLAQARESMRRLRKVKKTEGVGQKC